MYLQPQLASLASARSVVEVKAMGASCSVPQRAMQSAADRLRKHVACMGRCIIGVPHHPVISMHAHRTTLTVSKAPPRLAVDTEELSRQLLLCSCAW